MTEIDVHIEQEDDIDRGWRYLAVCRRGEGSDARPLTIDLAWVDHDHWSHGAVPPSRTIEALLEVMLETLDDHAIPSKFDAASVRRWIGGLDDAIRDRLADLM